MKGVQQPNLMISQVEQYVKTGKKPKLSQMQKVKSKNVGKYLN